MYGGGLNESVCQTWVGASPLESPSVTAIGRPHSVTVRGKHTESCTTGTWGAEDHRGYCFFKCLRKENSNGFFGRLLQVVSVFATFCVLSFLPAISVRFRAVSYLEFYKHFVDFYKTQSVNKHFVNQWQLLSSLLFVDWRMFDREGP